MKQATGRLFSSLYFQVLLAITIGITLGHFYPDTGTAMQPLGTGFIKLIKMIIAPIIFCTVVIGIAGMEDMKRVGKTGGYALLYFEIVSTIALVIGLVVINVVQPGPIDTDANPEDGPMRELMHSFMAIKRHGRPEEVAGMVAWLAGPEAGFVTGAMHTIDGAFGA